MLSECQSPPLQNQTFVNKKTMASVLKLMKSCNCLQPTALPQKGYHPFVIDGVQVGLVRAEFLKYLLQYPDVFQFQSEYVVLNPTLKNYVDRTKKVDAVLRNLRSQNVVSTLSGWRDEDYEVRTSYSSEKLMKMDRSATCIFGICNYGVDINGYTNDPEKGLCIWLQKRSLTKQRWPGKWDNMVGGGLSSGYSILDTAFKEAEEEASIPSEFMLKLKPCGSVSFFFENEQGLFPNTEFVFDLELPSDFVPKNKDGEVEEFELFSAQDVLKKAFTPEFKTTSCPVLIDFLIRHGYIRPDDEPHYPEIVELLHVSLQSMYGKSIDVRSVEKNGATCN
ncbi:hypothetical protein V9T40_003703 [Parthenolecanium corni]|uniref:Nudix hydrolase domain-containing protein n=1 Tax=Parthenolecanium corni TaxID=536013 RepID=A0AAN9U1C9_9HEMI